MGQRANFEENIPARPCVEVMSQVFITPTRHAWDGGRMVIRIFAKVLNAPKWIGITS